MNEAKVFAELGNQGLPRVNVNSGFLLVLQFSVKTIVRLKMTSFKYNGSTWNYLLEHVFFYVNCVYRGTMKKIKIKHKYKFK